MKTTNSILATIAAFFILMACKSDNVINPIYDLQAGMVVSLVEGKQAVGKQKIRVQYFGTSKDGDRKVIDDFVTTVETNPIRCTDANGQQLPGAQPGASCTCGASAGVTDRIDALFDCLTLIVNCPDHYDPESLPSQTSSGSCSCYDCPINDD